MRTELLAIGSLSRTMVIEVLSQYETLMTTQTGEQGQIAETEAQMLTIKAKMAESITQFVADQTNKYLEAERKADRIAQDLVKAKVKNERTTLRSPISGSVQQLAVTTVGQVVSSGQSVMVVVPQDSAIEIEAMVENQDIGFVEEGQTAIVKIEAFPFTRFGTLNGRVERVSRDAVDQREAQTMADPVGSAKQNGTSAGGAQSKTQGLVFPATVRLERASIAVDGKSIPLSPGMVVTVEILTGQRRAIDYLLSPLREIASTTARER
jgi:hemolysin D